MNVLRTERLELRPIGLEGARLELGDRSEFYRRFDAPAPPSWPPPLNDEASMTYWVRTLEAAPEHAVWCAWVMIAVAPRRLIGNGGFKGPPTPAGDVEIGYSVLPEEQGQGFAIEAARGLLSFARSAPEVRRVLAHTLEDGHDSQNVLRKCGFTLAGAAQELGVLKWALDLKRLERGK